MFNAVMFGLLILSNSNATALSGDAASLIQQAYDAYCKNEVENQVDILKSLSKSHGELFESSYLSAFGSAGYSGKIRTILAENKAKTESERLALVYALLVSRSSDLERVNDLLNFQSADNSRESHRLFLASSVAVIGRSQGSELLFLRAIRKAPFPTAPMLHALINLDGKNPANKEFIKELSTVFERKAAFSENPKFAKSIVDYLRGGADLDDWQRYDIIKRAYESCSKDSGMIELWAYELLRQGDTSKAYQILDGLMKSEHFPTAHSEFLLADAADRIGNHKIAIEYYKRVVDSKNLYSSEYEKEFSKGRLSNLNHHWSFWHYIITAGTLLLPVLLIFIHLMKRKIRKEKI